MSNWVKWMFVSVVWGRWSNWSNFGNIFYAYLSPSVFPGFMDECLSFLISWTHQCLSETPLWREVRLNSWFFLFTAKRRRPVSTSAPLVNIRFHLSDESRLWYLYQPGTGVCLEQVDFPDQPRTSASSWHLLNTCDPNWSLNRSKLDRIGVACCGLDLQVCTRLWRLIVSLFRSQAPKRIQ